MIGERPLFPSLRAVFLVAFLVVAGSGIAVLSVASWLTATADSARHEQQEREHSTGHIAEVAGEAYADSGGWSDADLGKTEAVATAAGGRVVVLDHSGVVVHPQSAMTGDQVDGMPASGDEAREDLVMAPVTVSGRPAGSVAVRYGPQPAEIDPVALGWISGAAGVAVIVALLATALLARRLVLPLQRLIVTARRFAAGDRTARAHTEAPGELGQLARDFDAMADEIARTERVRQQMAADVAHELRNPLTALQAGLEEVRDGLVPADRHALGRLHRQALQLGRVVADLGELAAPVIVEPSVRAIPVGLDEVVTDEVDSRRLLALEAGIRFDVGAVDPVVVDVDPDRLRQIIGNVLSNSLKYCRRGDSIAVATRLVAAAGDGGEAMGEFVCCDTGPGIAPEHLPRVFERSWREDPHTRAGSGLGLAVAQRLAQDHGGCIDITSDGRTGVTVTLQLPLSAAP